MLEFNRLLSTKETHPYDTVLWEKTDIQVISDNGRIIYDCKGAEFPTTWSDSARRITASKFFRESRTVKDCETSAKQMLERVTATITSAGIAQGYFDNDSADIFGDELRHVLLEQRAAFNSPVYFNVGIPGLVSPQVSACFILDVQDDMSSILQLAVTEGLVFKEGSGSGVNYSNLRGSNESIRGGGTASGPVSFNKALNSFAGVILSGGRTRRAARMVILDADHPDIFEFITCKAEQEDFVALLVDAGFSPKFTDPNSAYNFVAFQNGNHSVRVTDAFMQTAREIIHGYQPDTEWELHYRHDTSLGEKVSHRKLFRTLAEAAWKCGDPGLHFEGAVNRMNTCSADENIVSSNPCAEFVFLNNSACNLASLNLDTFAKEDRTFDVKTFRHVVRIMTTAQDILVDLGSYPTEKIKQNSHDYRPLGLGYANLGGLLMGWGLAYDSQQGRDLAASITSLMTAQAYLTSTEIAEIKEPFAAFERNKTGMEDVLDIHYTETRKLEKDIAGISTKATAVWQDVMSRGFGRKRKEDGHGFRNAQVTLLAPTGTISWLMDCATSGIEPDVALQKTKFMVGGNKITYTNPSIGKALKHLGYSESECATLLTFVENTGHFEGSSLRQEHLSVFDCAIPAKSRSISVDGHILMLAAVQPFLSGAISKTVNLPNDATVDDIERVFLKAWENKLKGVTIYREGSKMSEPLRIKELKEKKIIRGVPQRCKLPDDLAQSPRHKFSIGGHTGYLHIGLSPETNEPIEVFIRMAKFGSTFGGLLDSYAILFSKALQYGIPLEELISHMQGSKFPPSGFTANPKVRSAGSILDYLGQYLRIQYLDEDGDFTTSSPSIIPTIQDDEELADDINGEICPECGALMRKAGACSTCTNCPYSSGVCG